MEENRDKTIKETDVVLDPTETRLRSSMFNMNPELPGQTKSKDKVPVASLQQCIDALTSQDYTPFLVDEFISMFFLHLFLPISIPFAWLKLGSIRVRNHVTPSDIIISIVFVLTIWGYFRYDDLGRHTSALSIAVLMNFTHKTMVAVKYGFMNPKFQTLLNTHSVPVQVKSSFQLISADRANELMIR